MRTKIKCIYCLQNGLVDKNKISKDKEYKNFKLTEKGWICIECDIRTAETILPKKIPNNNYFRNRNLKYNNGYNQAIDDIKRVTGGRL